MSRDGSGNYTLPAGINPVATGTTITSNWGNTTLEDVATAMTDSLSRSGNGGMLAPFRATDGTVSAPSMSFNSETNSGIYRAGTNDYRLAVNGVDKARITDTAGMAAFQVYNSTTSTWETLAMHDDISAGLSSILALGNNTGSNNVIVDNNYEIQFGSTGNANKSSISNSGTDTTWLQSGVGGLNLYLDGAGSGIEIGKNQYQWKIDTNGKTTIRHGYTGTPATVLETEATGINVTGTTTSDKVVISDNSTDAVQLQITNGVGASLEVNQTADQGGTVVQENGTGSLTFKANDFYLQDSSDSTNRFSFTETNTTIYNGGGGAEIITRTGNDGVTFQDDVYIKDNKYLYFGDSNDLRIYHAPDNNYINTNSQDLTLGAPASKAINFANTGATRIIIDDSGLKTNGASGIKFGSSVYMDGVSTDLTTTATTTTLADSSAIKAYVDSQVGASDTLSEVLANGNTTGVTKIEVNNTSGGIDLIDNAKILFGTGDDLEIYHDGSDSIIAEATGTGDLLIRGNNLKLQKGDGAEDYLVATMNDSVAIKHDNATKLETSTSGVTVTGTVTSDGLSVDAGSSNTDVTIHSSTGSAKLHINTDGTGGTDYGIIELGGTDGAFIDIKEPNSDDYDLRIEHGVASDNVSFVSSKDPLVLQTQPTSAGGTGGEVTIKREGSTKLATSATGIDVTGTITATGDISTTGTGAKITAEKLNINSGKLFVDDANNYLVKMGGYGSGNFFGTTGQENCAQYTVGVGYQGKLIEETRIQTFKITGAGFLNMHTTNKHVLVPKQTGKYFVVTDYEIYNDYGTRTGTGTGGWDVTTAPCYLLGTFNNSDNTGNFFSQGGLPRSVAIKTGDWLHHKDPPISDSGGITIYANRDLMIYTQVSGNNITDINAAPDGSHYIKIKYRILDATADFIQDPLLTTFNT
tara:strand:+ start:14957 stop:17719 length:2763 start_codon:yes stop_codon:yes gene_type:complete